MAQCSKTRRFLSEKEKQKVLSELKAGKPPLNVADEFGIIAKPKYIAFGKKVRINWQRTVVR